MKKSLFALLYVTGVTRLVAWFHRNRQTILCYHSITMLPSLRPDDIHKQHLPQHLFQQHLAHLEQRYNIISLQDYLDLRREGRTPPPYSVVLTFDDGVRNFFTVAAPLLLEHALPATNFIVIKLTKSQSYSQKDSQWTPQDDETYLSWNEMQELASSRLMSFGSHTYTHPKLTEISVAETKRELEDSYNAIAERLKFESLALSYPHNKTSDTIREMAESVGYACALTADLGPNEPDHDLYSLRRTVIAADDDIATFAARVAGLTWWAEKIRAAFRQTLKKFSKEGSASPSHSSLEGLDYE